MSAIDCVVVGDGPAGLTAAHYLRRFRRDVIVFGDGDSRAKRIPRTHNYPGFPEGVEGGELVARMRTQLEACGGSVRVQTVLALRRDGGRLVVEAGNESIDARTVVIATGVCDVEPDLPHLAEVRRGGLWRQCPVCDGYEFSDRRIGVIGAGRHGVREARFLQHFSSRVTLVDAGETPVADGLARIVGTVLDAAPCERGVRIRMADGRTHEFDVLYAALGSIPNSRLGVGLGAAADDGGNLVIDAHCRTSVPGVYAIGDVVVGLDQIAVAVGQAAIAATTVHNDLQGGGV